MAAILPLRHELHYRALGLVKGQLQPSGSYSQGVLVAADGTEYPATPGRPEMLQKFAYCLEQPLPRWYCVQPQPRNGGILGLSLIKVWSLAEPDPDLEEDVFPPAPAGIEEGFQIRGDVLASKGFLTVVVRRKPQGSKQFPPLTLRLEGFLPGVANGEFWDLQAERDGQQLVLVDGTRLLEAAEIA